MVNWRIKIVITLALAIVLAGLVMLSIPKPHGGPMLLQWAPDHSLYLADVMGLGLSAMGTFIAWATGLVWQQRRR